MQTETFSVSITNWVSIKAQFKNAFYRFDDATKCWTMRTAKGVFLFSTRNNRSATNPTIEITARKGLFSPA